MKELNLYRLFEVCDILSEKQYELAENNVYISLLGINSEFSAYSFEQFLNYYSFRIEEENVVVFSIPYEDYNNNDVSYIPICLLSFSAEKIEEWIETEIQKQLKEQEKEKQQRKSHIESEIKRLGKQLKELQ